jgi:hypothetical protein
LTSPSRAPHPRQKRGTGHNRWLKQRQRRKQRQSRRKGGFHRKKRCADRRDSGALAICAVVPYIPAPEPALVGFTVESTVLDTSARKR